MVTEPPTAAAAPERPSEPSSHLADDVWGVAEPTAFGYRRIAALELAAVLGRVPVIELTVNLSSEAGSVPTSEVVDSALVWSHLAGRAYSATLAVICEDGSVSAWWAARLAKAGFDRVLHLWGGTRAWRAAGLPISG